jgi:hypothetical protein
MVIAVVDYKKNMMIMMIMMKVVVMANVFILGLKLLCPVLWPTQPPI